MCQFEHKSIPDRVLKFKTMSTDHWQQLKELFHATFDLNESERTAFLAKACVGNDELRGRVEALIASHTQAGLFLVTPALVDVGIVTVSEQTEEELVTSLAGQRIGPYQIIREIGRGGMGTVYLAERADDQYRKQVAIKLIKRGMDTDAILHRFMMERQILANLEHPHIARLLDGGTSSDGRPYFVMEYIQGQTITEYCDERRMTTAARLELFRHVCSALQYAHQNLVVHRDIKPGNIIVTAEGVPKLLDFGIAKLLSPNWATETGAPTLSMVQVLTPEYASPEQLRGLPITTASDVYSLGVVLYELLSGHRPYHADARTSAEMARVILEEEPLKPSVVITVVEEAHHTAKDAGVRITPESVGQTREGTVEQLRRRLSGDLDNIVLKALRKEPERRYASAQELSEDIRRHLAGLPVSARQDIFTYRAGKFIRRHKAGGLAALFVFLALLLGTATTAWQSWVARQERDKSDRRFNEVRKLARTVLFEYHDQIAKLPGSTPLREKMVKDALIYLDTLATESGNDAGLQREIAAAYHKVGDVQGNPYQSNLGDIEGALTSYHKALKIRETLAAQNSAIDADTRRDLAKSHEAIGDILWTKGDYAAAEASYRRTLQICEALSNSAEGTPEDIFGIARSLHRIGQALSRSGDSAGALKSFSSALDEFEKLTTIAPDVMKYRRGKGSGYLKIGDIMADRGDWRAALEYHRKALELWSALSAAEPLHPSLKRDVTIATSRIATDLKDLNDLGNALESMKQVVKAQEALVAADPQNAQFNSELGTDYAMLGSIQGKMKNFVAAQENLRRGLKILREMSRSKTKSEDIQRDLALAYVMAGSVSGDKGDLTEARENYQQALAILEVEPARSASLMNLAQLYEALGDLQARQAERMSSNSTQRTSSLSEAGNWYQKSLAVWRELHTQDMTADYQNKPRDIAQKLARCSPVLATISH